jgi:hypothetical protein
MSRKIDLREKALPAALAAVAVTFGASAVNPFPDNNRQILFLKKLLLDLLPPIMVRSVRRCFNQ